MPTPVVMPQMGESIAEGTIVRWIKKVGDSVDRDEPLFEISTDKVDAEIPSPAAGVLAEIKAKEGDTVAVNSVVATIAMEGEAVAPPDTGARSQGEGHSPGQAQAQGQAPGQSGLHLVSRQKSSPLVRRIAKEHNVDISQIHGSGIGGRVTKHDILGFIGGQTSEVGGQTSEVGGQTSEVGGRRSEVGDRRSEVGARETAPSPAPSPTSDFRRPTSDNVEPLSIMRRKIAEHMILSRRTSAHVHSVFHVNFSTVERIRQQKKAEYERVGAKLTFMAFIAKAVIDALRRHRIVNASLDGDHIVYHNDINLGIAVALETGLIVPVIKHADEKNLLGLTRAIADVAERARAKQLRPEEVQGGTFTITNPGQFGAQFGMPIINQPQSAILGVGTIEKRPVVADDAIAIRTMAYLTLGFDHRLIDGAVADQFMADVKQQIEHFDLNQV